MDGEYSRGEGSPAHFIIHTIAHSCKVVLLITHLSSSHNLTLHKCHMPMNFISIQMESTISGIARILFQRKCTYTLISSQEGFLKRVLRLERKQAWGRVLDAFTKLAKTGEVWRI